MLLFCQEASGGGRVLIFTNRHFRPTGRKAVELGFREHEFRAGQKVCLTAILARMSPSRELPRSIDFN